MSMIIIMGAIISTILAYISREFKTAFTILSIVLFFGSAMVLLDGIEYTQNITILNATGTIVNQTSVKHIIDTSNYWFMPFVAGVFMLIKIIKDNF